MKNGDVPIRYVNVYQAGYPSSGMTFFRVELVESGRVMQSSHHCAGIVGMEVFNARGME